MNTKFNDKVQAWLAQDSDKRDYAEGAMLLLQLTGNQIMYRNLMANPKRNAPFIEYQLKKRLNFRLQQVTHEQVEQMQAQVDKIVVNRNLEPKHQEKPANEFKTGKRADHDELPDEIQALYVENLGIVQKMRELHLKLRTLSLANATCPDSERYPFLKELIALDKRLHSNWEQYDHYTGTDGEQRLTADVREESKKAVRMVNLAKGRYAKKPSEELKAQILENYSKIINPTDKLTKELKEMGIIK